MTTKPILILRDAGNPNVAQVLSTASASTQTEVQAAVGVALAYAVSPATADVIQYEGDALPLRGANLIVASDVYTHAP